MREKEREREGGKNGRRKKGRKVEKRYGRDRRMDGSASY